MIDIHSHILPGLDDGPPNLEEALQMLRVAADAGTTDIAATPHANLQFSFRPELIEERITELVAAAGAVPRIHCGCDFHLFYDNIQDALAHPTRYTINHKSYLLVEFPDLLIAKSTSEVFLRMLEAGIVPIITHPERNYLLHRRIDQLARWVEMGCLLQVTGQSFLGRFGAQAKRFAHELMKRGLVHIVASDAHDPVDRSPRLDEVCRFLAKKYGGERAERLLSINPQAVLAGEPLDFDLPQAGPPRKWYRFWS